MWLFSYTLETGRRYICKGTNDIWVHYYYYYYLKSDIINFNSFIKKCATVMWAVSSRENLMYTSWELRIHISANINILWSWYLKNKVPDNGFRVPGTPAGHTPCYGPIISHHPCEHSLSWRNFGQTGFIFSGPEFHVCLDPWCKTPASNVTGVLGNGGVQGFQVCPFSHPLTSCQLPALWFKSFTKEWSNR